MKYSIHLSKYSRCLTMDKNSCHFHLQYSKCILSQHLFRNPHSQKYWIVNKTFLSSFVNLTFKIRKGILDFFYIKKMDVFLKNIFYLTVNKETLKKYIATNYWPQLLFKKISQFITHLIFTPKSYIF